VTYDEFERCRDELMPANITLYSSALICFVKLRPYIKKYVLYSHLKTIRVYKS